MYTFSHFFSYLCIESVMVRQPVGVNKTDKLVHLFSFVIEPNVIFILSSHITS